MGPQGLSSECRHLIMGPQGVILRMQSFNHGTMGHPQNAGIAVALVMFYIIWMHQCFLESSIKAINQTVISNKPNISLFMQMQYYFKVWCHLQGHMDGLVQEKHNSIADALELHLSCTNPSISALDKISKFLWLLTHCGLVTQFAYPQRGLS